MCRIEKNLKHAKKNTFSRVIKFFKDKYKIAYSARTEASYTTHTIHFTHRQLARKNYTRRANTHFQSLHNITGRIAATGNQLLPLPFYSHLLLSVEATKAAT